MDFNQQPTASIQHLPQRFLECSAVTHIPNPNNPRVLFSNGGSLHVEFDSIQTCQDVINAHSSLYSTGVGIALSSNNLLYIKPTAPPNGKMNFLLSDLISGVLPKLKIVAIYHPTNNTADVVSSVFLDDNSDNTLQQWFISTFSASASSNVTFGPGDVYHELTIADDANIVWDACRDLIE